MDNSNTNIGKRYIRADEMGIKYVITIDFETINDNQITIRERDSMQQKRIKIDSIIVKLMNLKINQPINF